MYLQNVVHPFRAKAVLANWEETEANSSPNEIGYGAISTAVGIVQGDDVGDGPVASHIFRGEMFWSMKLRGRVKFPLKTDKTRVESYTVLLVLQLEEQ
jgi:hypothetical protein